MSLLDDDAISAALAGLQWERQGDELVKEHKGRDFAAAMVFVNAVAERAEAANHHPDIDIRWNTVTLRLSTHSAGGLTQADLDMAREIDGLAAAG
jgi:4a-hydroxytetrahydrobiopterin dehydratase